MGKAGQGIRSQYRRSSCRSERETNVSSNGPAVPPWLADCPATARLQQAKEAISVIINQESEGFLDGSIVPGLQRNRFCDLARTIPSDPQGRMGPGYFPTVLSCLLMGFGILAVLRGVRQQGAAFGSSPGSSPPRCFPQLSLLPSCCRVPG